MSKLTFFGASSTVTGSSFLLDGKSSSLLVDLGLFQDDTNTEDPNHEKLPFDARKIQTVLITHAHLDHCGRLPVLVTEGFNGKIYMTAATRDIAEISLRDSAKIAERKEEEEKIVPMYTMEAVERVLEMIEIAEYGVPIDSGEFNFTFRDAGHILGSASIEIKDGNGKVYAFSGDLGNTPEDIVKPTETIAHADIVVMESTYGGQKHPQEDVDAVLQHEINEIEETQGVLIIPAFSIERTQEIIHRIGHLAAQKKINASTPIYVDSPMSIAVTEVFKKYPNLYNNEIKNDESPFEFESLIPTTSSHESKEIMKAKAPKVIIAGSGMMSGGRVHFHLKNYISNHNTRLLIVGYQAEGTLGRKIEDGAKQILLFDQEVQVNGTVTKIESMSSHADEPKLLNWLKNIQGVQKVFIVHGDDDRRKLLAEDIKTKLGIQSIELPQKGQTFEV